MLMLCIIFAALKAHLAFFAVMFGSSLVEPYIGELWIASTADSVMKDAQTQQAMMDAEKADSEEEMAKNLANRAALSVL